MDLNDLFEGNEGGIPSMITIEMRQHLLTKGYDESDIEKMTPKEAWEILSKKPNLPEEPPVIDNKRTAYQQQIQDIDKTDDEIDDDLIRDIYGDDEIVSEKEPEEPEQQAPEKIDIDDSDDFADDLNNSESDLDEPQLDIEPADEFEARILQASSYEEYVALLEEKNAIIKENIAKDNLSEEEREFKISKLIKNLRATLENVEAHFENLLIARGDRENFYESGHDLTENSIEILAHKRKIFDIISGYPANSSGFAKYLSPESKQKSESEPKYEGRLTPVKDKLERIIKKAIDNSGEAFVDDPNGLEQYINELGDEHLDYRKQILDLTKKAAQAENSMDNAKTEDEAREFGKKQIEYSMEANKLLAEFRDKHSGSEKLLEDSDFRDQNWYSKKYRDYMLEATTLPGAPVSINDSLKKLAEKGKFTASAAKYPDVSQVVDDRALISQVARGVKPLAHTKSHRREIKLNREETQRLAYMIAPSQMGGGVIWYQPGQRAGERAYDERILGLDPELDKEDRPSTKPYNPLAKDENLNIVELYIWNNIANRSDPKLYNFINGLCLGYPRDYIIWFCESRYGQIDHRKPERTFWGRMLDKFRYCVNANVNGYGRPGTIKPDGMFSKIFKSLTPKFINNWTNKILGTSDELDIDDFASAANEFTPTRTPEKTEFDQESEDDLISADINKSDDPIIESIFTKLDKL